jgi:hypothetical protein
MRTAVERSPGVQNRVVRAPNGSEQALTIPIQKAVQAMESSMVLLLG